MIWRTHPVKHVRNDGIRDVDAVTMFDLCLLRTILSEVCDIVHICCDFHTTNKYLNRTLDDIEKVAEIC